jgi:hypothetical protein
LNGQPEIVPLGHLVDERYERRVRGQRPRLLAQPLVHLGNDPLFDRGHVEVHHPVDPVDRLGHPRQPSLVLLRQTSVRSARVRAVERPVGLCAERLEQSLDLGNLAGTLGDPVERLRRRSERCRGSSHCRRELARDLRDRRRSGQIEPSPVDERRLDARKEEVDERVADPFSLKKLPFVNADELAESLCGARVDVACAKLIHGRGRTLEQLSERQDHSGDHVVGRNQVERHVAGQDLDLPFHH